MPKQQPRLILAILAALLLAPWPVAFVHDYAAASQKPVQIEAAEPSAAPSWQVFGRAIGGVDTPGDLFYVDASRNAADILAMLYLTNTKELVSGYRYLTLKVGVYVQTDGGDWQPASWRNGEPVPETYITLHNGQVSFTLPGHAKYKVTIDRGSFYANGTGAGSVSPQFYLTVDRV